MNGKANGNERSSSLKTSATPNVATHSTSLPVPKSKTFPNARYCDQCKELTKGTLWIAANEVFSQCGECKSITIHDYMTDGEKALAFERK